MKRGGAAPKTPPTGWVFCRRHNSEGFTIRWRRGDREAAVLRGNQVGSWTTGGLLGTIPVPVTGWTDLVQIRVAGENWGRVEHSPK